ncbi:helix-turn-helix domain-containing protein [Kribbella pittospori]|uniref:helix-turn-helix domain-containing protein n=1 Tax=Kribbella pittospori TaxID=722689 RepID=UPI0013F3BFD2|nr:helix-turn-helix domain-containing protein [Kribbella pittospori]
MEDTFAARLRDARRARDLTQESLAEQAGLSAQAIGLLERGVRRFPHPTTIDKLDKALQLTPEELAAFKRLASRGAASPTATQAKPAGPAWVVARQLPSVNAGFAGRTQQVDQLIDLLSGTPAQPGSPIVATIRGMAGVGKTALAIQAAHTSADQYPDGTLLVNLRGFGAGTPVSPLHAIGQLLRGTGVPPDAVPGSLVEAVAALRSRLADRRVLLILDNAHDVGQVAELIPAASGSAVLITSRATLTAQPASLHLQLEPMPADESLHLLETIAGAHRLASAAARVAELCGHLPLALSVAGAWLVRHPSASDNELAQRLEDESRRLDLLGVDDLDVRASLSLSIEQLNRSADPLDHSAAQALILLSLSDAEDFTAETSAALIDTQPAEADRLLERLTDVHLLESRAPGRYLFHDLVRAFGRELAAGLPEDERTAALDRSLALYLAVAWRANEMGDPKAARMAWPERPPAPAFPTFTRLEQALAWIDDELRNCLALVDQVRTLGGRDELAAGLIVGLYNYFAMRGSMSDWLPAIDNVAAGRIERWTLAQLHADAAIALAELARYDESAQRFGLAREVFESIGNLRGVSLATNNKARLLIRMHRYREALPLVEHALAVNQQLGNDRGLAASQLTLTEVYTELGDWNAAEAASTAAVELFAAAGDESGAANGRIDRAWARARAGRPESAVAEIVQAMGVLDVLGYRKSVSDGHYVLGMVYAQLKDFESAIEQTEHALEVALDVGDLRREAQARLELGRVLNDIGEPDDAVPNLEFALAFYREHDAALVPPTEDLLEAARKAAGA